MKNIKQKIVIAGGTGFIGEYLEKYLTANGYEIIIFSRKPKKENHIKWDGKNIGSWVNHLNKCKALINLSGKSVDCRYTKSNKEAILNSRIDSTNVLNEAMSTLSHPPTVWLNASSATTYIHSEKNGMTESNGIIGDDFSMNVCKAWEKVFFKNQTECTRKVALRMSIVLGKNGGAFPKLKLLTKLGFGGSVSNGKQKISWIHIDDLCDAILFTIKNENINGPVNITSPIPLSNRKFMTKLRKGVNIPFGIPISRTLIYIGAFLARTEAELLLKSRFVIPEKLLNNGFYFNYKTIEQALNNLINGHKTEHSKIHLNSSNI